MQPSRPSLPSTTKILIGVLVAAAGWSARAQGGVPGYPDGIWAYDPREVAMLPRYCVYTQVFRGIVKGGNDPAQIAAWTAVMGDNFRHMHHFCWGLMKTNRAIFLAADARSREFYLRDAIPEFDYVIDRVQDDFLMLPEVLTKKADTLIRLGQGPMGVLDLERAVTLKRDYWPPYARLSDYYKDTGDAKLAREWLEKGLAENPDAVGLKRRLAELSAGKAPAAKPGSRP